MMSSLLVSVQGFKMGDYDDIGPRLVALYKFVIEAKREPLLRSKISNPELNKHGLCYARKL